jgi:tRNA(fMet)-specific endonuclease VapC
MIRYFLDTNICIYLIKKKPEILLTRLHKAVASGVGISSITLSELEFGVQKSTRIEQNSISLLRFLSLFEIAPFGEAAAREYGIVRAELERKGKPIGNMDMLIGAHAKSADVVLVTNNEREFSRINGLQIENWIHPAK